MPSLGLRTRKSAGASRLRVPTGVWNVLVGGRLQLGLRFWFPPDPRRRCCSNVFEPKLVDSLLYVMIEFFNHVCPFRGGIVGRVMCTYVVNVHCGVSNVVNVYCGVSNSDVVNVYCGVLHVLICDGFGFIKCFTTTFLHSLLAALRSWIIIQCISFVHTRYKQHIIKTYNCLFVCKQAAKYQVYVYLDCAAITNTKCHNFPTWQVT